MCYIGNNDVLRLGQGMALLRLTETESQQIELELFEFVLMTHHTTEMIAKQSHVAVSSVSRLQSGKRYVSRKDYLKVEQYLQNH